jgi:hypothetical protein
MRCEELKKNLILRTGDLFLNEEEKKHIAGCPECARFFENLQLLENKLAQASVPPLRPNEFNELQERLEKRIEKFQSRAINYYRLSLRYGASLAALAILLFISYFGRIGMRERNIINVDSLLAELQTLQAAEDAGDIDIDDQYLETVIGNYVQIHGFSAGEALIGDLSEEELEYLKNNIKVGDIL